MVDYDVMVFIRFKQPFWFLKIVDVLYQDVEKAIVIVSHSWYKEQRQYMIDNGSDIVSELQLIKPKGVVAY